MRLRGPVFFRWLASSSVSFSRLLLLLYQPCQPPYRPLFPTFGLPCVFELPLTLPEKLQPRSSSALAGRVSPATRTMVQARRILSPLLVVNSYPCERRHLVECLF